MLDPDLRSRMGNANREKVDDFRPDIVGKEYMAALTAIVGSASKY